MLGTWPSQAGPGWVGLRPGCTWQGRAGGSNPCFLIPATHWDRTIRSPVQDFKSVSNYLAGKVLYQMNYDLCGWHMMTTHHNPTTTNCGQIPLDFWVKRISEPKGAWLRKPLYYGAGGGKAVPPFEISTPNIEKSEDGGAVYPNIDQTVYGNYTQHNKVRQYRLGFELPGDYPDYHENYPNSCVWGPVTRLLW